MNTLEELIEFLDEEPKILQHYNDTYIAGFRHAVTLIRSFVYTLAAEESKQRECSGEVAGIDR